jgi:hypothetical protein
MVERNAAVEGSAVGSVDHEDDSIRRWVIYHYRFDPERHERRNVVVAAFDNQREFREEFRSYSATIQREISSGARSSRETISGVELEPGHLRAASLGPKVRRAIEHGVNPSRLLRTGPLPSNLAIFGPASTEATNED